MVKGEAEARDLGLVILTHIPDARLIDSVSSVLASSVQPGHVLFVDNASPIGYLDGALEVLPEAHVLRLETNVGYGGAMNAGAKALISSGCRRLMFMTHETVLASDAIQRMLFRFGDRAEIGLVGPVLGTLSARETVWSAGGELTKVRRAPRHAFARRPMSALPDQGAHVVAWLDGACLMARSEAFTAVGGFREDLFLYCEDIDLARRMNAHHWKVECVRGARAFQESSSTPPYLEARNRALVLGVQGTVGVVVDLVLRMVADLVRGRGLRRGALMVLGLRDAARGRLDRSLAMERPE
jgi:N-acetylglucosaminyl-diphospho-decaprenol L-rhamnosyltransferase